MNLYFIGKIFSILLLVSPIKVYLCIQIHQNYYNQSTWRNFKVIPFSNPKIKEYLPNYKEVYNTYKAVVQKMDNEITVKDAAE